MEDKRKELQTEEIHNAEMNQEVVEIITEEQLEEVEKYIEEELAEEDIPEGLLPENMRMKLEEAQVLKVKNEKTRKVKKWTGILATAACLGILVTAGFHAKDFGTGTDAVSEETVTEGVTENQVTDETMGNGSEDAENQVLYGQIYEAMNKQWAMMYPELEEGYATGTMGGGPVKEELEMETTTTTDGAPMEGGFVTDDAVVEESTMESMDTMSGVGDMNTNTSSDKIRGDYGETNVQVEFVDEGDIIKNDGRYLYQIAEHSQGNGYGEKIQITDTKDGLKKLAEIKGFENIREFYVYEDKIVVIENLWARSELEKGGTIIVTEEDVEYSAEEAVEPEEEVEDATVETAVTIDEAATEDVLVNDVMICGPYYGGSTAFSKVHVYDIADRSNPTEIHTFTIKGNYRTSRISDGYLYFFTGYDTGRPETKEDFEQYIPMVDGKLFGADSLYLPETTDATSYLMMLSIDMANPTTFTDKMAAVTWGNYYYVSGKNIYVLDNQWAEQKEGIQCDKTRIIKFSYEKGQIEPVCESVVDGTMLDQFAMDEYKGYFRLITTVNPYKLEKVVDDVSGEEIGYYNWEYMPESNSVYVLDENLKVAGSLEGLAKEERVYSARFMGDTGYFVTFRQVDPLFSVDFSNPKEPKILGELKISGFSEYLHFYGEDLLLGIGYEADENTGRTEGIKLSMFDVSDPSNVKEVNKLVTEYDHSDALYNHHSVLVSVSKNLIGFMAEHYENDVVREYATYSYQPDNGFKARFTVDCSPTEENGYRYYEGRGTYINDTFYMLMNDGSIEAYDLNSGKLIEELQIEK